MSAADFTEVVAAVLARSLPQAELTVSGPLVLELHLANGDTATVRLHNPWRAVGDQPERWAAAAGTVLSALRARQGAPATPSLARLVPLVRTRTWRQALAAARGGLHAPVHQPLAGPLEVVLGWDEPDRIVPLGQVEADRLARTAPALVHRAVQNLSERPPPVLEGAGPVWRLRAGGDHDSALLLVDALWSRLEGQLGSAALAAVPSRGCLLLSGSAEVGGRAALAQAAATAHAREPHPLWPGLLRRTHGAWTTDTPP